jgi:PAS domain S-box-containing protein
MRFGIGAKLGVLASVLIVATGVTLAWWITHWSQQALHRQGRINLASETRLHGEELLASLRGLREEALRQATEPDLQDLLRARPTDRQVLERRVEEKFKTLLRKPAYLQVEFLSADADLNATISATRESARVRTDPRIYFPELHRARENRAWLSAIRKNDDAQIAGRAVAVCRAAVPLFLSENGRPRYAGALVLTMDLRPVIQQLQRSAHLLTFLSNEKGHFLIHPKRAEEFTFEKSADAATVPTLLPELAPYYDGSAQQQRFRYPETGGPWKSPDTYYVVTLTIKDEDAWADHTIRDAVRASLDHLSPGEDNLASEVDSSDQFLLLRGLDRERLKREAEALVRQFPTLLEVKSVRSWRNFAVQFVRLDYNPAGAGPPRWLGLVQAAAYEDLDEAVSSWEQQRILWLKLVLLIAIGAILAVFLSRRLTRPLKRITAATRGLAQGNFDVDLPVTSHDEIGTLARCFKDMAEQLQHNIQQKREEEARLSAVLRTAAEGIFILDEEGHILMLNQAAQRIFGYSDRELEGKNVKVLLPREVQGLPIEGRPELPSAIESIRLGKISNSTQEVIGQRKDGTTFPLELSVSDAPAGGRRIYTGIVRDITERKKAEQEIRDLNDHLRRLNEQLDRRVQERTRQLQKSNEELAVARDQALEASRVKSVFLGQMSHEFRTPLNHVKGYAELLLEEMEERGLEEFIPDLDKILKAARNLLYLVNDVLDLSSIEARQLDLNLEAFDVRATLDDLLRQLTPRLEANANELKLDCPESLGLMYADSKRVRQVLWNVLSNACKFTHNGRIDLEVKRHVQRGRDWLTFQVRDSGIGIPPEEMSKLFKAFSQIDNTTARKYDGSGLGLVISRSFCQMMGGDISAESEVGKGSTFLVRLPAQVTDGMPDGSGSTILMIGADGVGAELVREGIRAVPAGNGLEGLRLARRLMPAAIALDVELTGVSGWEVLAALKADPATARVPVILLTSADERSTALALGAADQLNKPVDREHLVALLGRFRPGLARGA